jgi:hypothetical protein
MSNAEASDVFLGTRCVPCGIFGEVGMARSDHGRDPLSSSKRYLITASRTPGKSWRLAAPLFLF